MTRPVHWSPLLLAVALSPAFLQIDCDTSGNANLVSAEIESDGLNRVVGFSSAAAAYDVWVGESTDTILVRATSAVPSARVTYRLLAGGNLETGTLGAGGGEATLTIPQGVLSNLAIDVSDGGARRTYSFDLNPPCSAGECNDANECTDDACNAASCEFTPVTDGATCSATTGGAGMCAVGVCAATPFSCDEQGILDAIATGGGPHRFDCAGPTTVVTTGTIVIDTDVNLDGESNLTVDGADTHTVFLVSSGTTAELRGMTVTNGNGQDAGGLHNLGSTTLVDMTFVGNFGGFGSAVSSDLFPQSVSAAELTMVDTFVTQNESLSGAAVASFGDMLTMLRTTVDGNVGAIGVWSPSPISITDSTVSNTAAQPGFTISEELSVTLSAVLLRSTIIASSAPRALSYSGSLEIRESLIVSQFEAANSIGGSETTANVSNSTIVGGWGQLFGTISFRSVTIMGPVLLNFVEEFAIANTVIEGSCTSVDTTTTSGGANIVAGSVSGCALSDPSDQVDVDPAVLDLGPLQDNGGPTDTLLPGPGSLLIDRIPPTSCVDADGLPLTIDQRGSPRPVAGLCDIGAVEVAQP